MGVGLVLPFEIARVCVQSLQCVWLFVTPWTVAQQAPLSMGFCRQEYWSGLPFPPPGNLPNPGIETESPVSPALQAVFCFFFLFFFYHWAAREVLSEINVHKLCNKTNQYLGWHYWKLEFSLWVSDVTLKMARKKNLGIQNLTWKYRY